MPTKSYYFYQSQGRTLYYWVEYLGYMREYKNMVYIFHSIASFCILNRNHLTFWTLLCVFNSAAFFVFCCAFWALLLFAIMRTILCYSVRKKNSSSSSAEFCFCSRFCRNFFVFKLKLSKHSFEKFRIGLYSAKIS